jgi:dihydroorotate dehydrogenase
LPRYKNGKRKVNMENNFKVLKRGVVLAELGGYADGKFCANNGKDASMVTLGTYIIDNDDSVDYPKNFVFKTGKKNYLAYLKDNILKARESRARIAVSAISINIRDSIDFLTAAQDAGADYASYCVHSTMKMFLDSNTSSALLLKKNWKNLKDSVKFILKEIEIPVIFKIGAFDNPDVFDAIEIMKDAGANLLHINIKSKKKGEGIIFLRKVNKEGLFIIAGSGIKTGEHAENILSAGADAVSIGSAAMRDPIICSTINKFLKQGLT